MVMDIVVAALPLAIVAVLLIGFLWPATRAMPIAWIAALGVGYVWWNNPPDYLAGSSFVGVMTALEILWIVFGALVLLYTLMQAGAFDRINKGFTAVSDDRRVQIVLIAFFLATFIEGAAGFGTPAAVVAPLMLALGFPALAAVIAALIGHIIAVTYGAVGTPIIVGIQDPLMIYEEQIVNDGGMSVVEYSHEVAAWAATYHALTGFLMPLFAVGMIVYFFSPPGERSLKPALSVWPLCLFAGFAFAIPYWAAAWFLTAEFPALIGAMVGGAITVGLLRRGYLLPDDEWDFPPREQWADHWVGAIEPGDDGTDEAVPNGGEQMSLLKAWSPYIVLIVLLVVTRVIDPISETITDAGLGTEFAVAGVGEFTIGVVIQWSEMFGYDLSAGIEWINAPGFWLLLSAIIAIGIFGMSGQQVKAAWAEAAKKLVSPFIALIFVIAMVQVMIQSGGAPGAPEAGSMIEILAIATADATGPLYPALAALIGALAAAMVGSNTVSNITFGGFQFTAAHELDLPSQIVVGTQAVGGAIGNLVAIHNIVAALATVGLVGQEGRVMRLNLIPLFYYALVVGVWALLFVYVMPDVLPSVFDVY
ncbi:L-lactate permease [Natronococcus occultus]|uniref:L-lactate permease n=1 Tax=Natronococcus occultus SP4 TaxID=694430 RepID=L0K4Q9_9EURY|nr:L-lactate permease [Natronococcus occultus]AGB40006.1 L-lactate permease [Natronococcus occultus SP4]